MPRAARIAFGGAALFAAGLIAYRIFLSFQSDETRIRNLMQNIASGFNDARAGRIADALADGYREETSGLTREEVRLILVQLFLRERDRRTKEFRHRVDIESMQFSFPEGAPDRAEIVVAARFSEKGDSKSERPVTRVEFTGALSRIDGEWRLQLSRHKIVEGNFRF